MLSQLDKEELLKEFPNIKLSYENVTHKKVYNADYYVAIPSGIKYFAWFTIVNDKNVCVMIELQNKEMKLVNTCFSNELSYGTILYGTEFTYKNSQFFSIEDIFSYRGERVKQEKWSAKLSIIHKMLKIDLNQIAYNQSFIVFGLPLMSKSNDELERKMLETPYKIDKIQFHLFERVNNYLYMDYHKYKNISNNYTNNTAIHTPIIHENSLNQKILKENTIKENLSKENKNKEFVFLVRPDVQVDIYYLFCLNEKNELEKEKEHHRIAHIPDFKTSVMMNKLFRLIKENDNLDALEESDDEEEFQNAKEDKFVHLDVSHKMICRYNHKFKKWYPVKLCLQNNTNNNDICKLSDITEFLKNNNNNNKFYQEKQYKQEKQHKEQIQKNNQHQNQNNRPCYNKNNYDYKNTQNYNKEQNKKSAYIV